MKLAFVLPGSAIISIGIAAGYATSHTLTRKLSATDPPLSILFYMTVVQLPLGLAPSLLDWVTPTLARRSGFAFPDGGRHTARLIISNKLSGDA